MYHFAQMTENDLPLLYRWANEPHVKPWWKTESDEAKFKEGFTAMLKSGKVQMYLVHYQDKPIGYIHFWLTMNDPQFVHLYPEGAVRMGQLIGEPSALRQGHGAKMIKEFSDKLLRKDEISMIMATVEKNNAAAIKAYKRAGFRHDADMESTQGPLALMERKRTWKLSTKK